MTDREKLKLLSIALFLEDNDNLSANRRKAKEIALELLGHSEKEFQEIYKTILRARELSTNME